MNNKEFEKMLCLWAQEEINVIPYLVLMRNFRFKFFRNKTWKLSVGSIIISDCLGF